jgi:hypothetical protein
MILEDDCFNSPKRSKGAMEYNVLQAIIIPAALQFCVREAAGRQVILWHEAQLHKPPDPARPARRARLVPSPGESVIF